MTALGAGAGLAQQQAAAEVYLERGSVKAEQSDTVSAIADFTRAIKFNPRYAKAYYRRAQVYRSQTKEFLPAITDYTRAFNLDPAAVGDLSPVFEKLRAQDTSGALAELTALIRTNPNDGFLYFARGYFRASSVGPNAARQESDAFIADFSKCLELAPNSADAYVLRANSFTNRQETAAAIADYTKAIELAPNLAAYYRLRAAQCRVLAEADENRAVGLENK